MTNKNHEQIELEGAQILIKVALFTSRRDSGQQDHEAATMALLARATEVYSGQHSTPCRVIFGNEISAAESDVTLAISGDSQ